MRWKDWIVKEESGIVQDPAGNNLSFCAVLCCYDYQSSGGGTDASITASTMGSVIVRYGLSLPPPESRTTVLNQYFESKGYSLVHAAPVVGVFILDHEGVPLPTPSEVANRVVPGKIGIT